MIMILMGLSAVSATRLNSISMWVSLPIIIRGSRVSSAQAKASNDGLAIRSIVYLTDDIRLQSECLLAEQGTSGTLHAWLVA